MVFKNKQLYFCQKIDKTNTKEEVKEFLEKILKIENLQINSQLKFTKKNTHKFLKIKKSHLLKFFLLYFFTLCFGFYILDFSKIDNQNILEKIRTNTKQIEFNSQFYFVSKELIDIFLLSKEHLVKVLKVSLINSKLLLELESSKKQDLYALFKKLEKFKVEDITYDSQRKVYLANAVFKIHRK